MILLHIILLYGRSQLEDKLSALFNFNFMQHIHGLFGLEFHPWTFYTSGQLPRYRWSKSSFPLFFFSLFFFVTELLSSDFSNKHSRRIIQENGTWTQEVALSVDQKKLILPQRRSSSFVPPMCHDPTRLPFAGALQIFIRYRSADEAAMMQLARKPTFPSNQQHPPSATITFITAPFRPDPTMNSRGCKLATSLAINVGWVLTLRSRVA